MSSSKRIVLVDPLGDILFSGESMIAKKVDEELCPETKRSADSGMFPAASPSKRAPTVTEATFFPDEAAPTEKKRDPRAA